MNIRINGKSETVEVPSSIARLVSDKALFPDRIVVEHNFRIVAKEEWTGLVLQEGDNVEIVSFVGGG